MPLVGWVLWSAVAILAVLAFRMRGDIRPSIVLPLAAYWVGIDLVVVVWGINKLHLLWLSPLPLLVAGIVLGVYFLADDWSTKHTDIVFRAVVVVGFIGGVSYLQIWSDGTTNWENAVENEVIEMLDNEARTLLPSISSSTSSLEPSNRFGRYVTWELSPTSRQPKAEDRSASRADKAVESRTGRHLGWTSQLTIGQSLKGAVLSISGDYAGVRDKAKIPIIVIVNPTETESKSYQETMRWRSSKYGRTPLLPSLQIVSMQTFTLTAWVFDRRSLKVVGRKAFGPGALPESGSYDVEGVIRSHQLDAMFRWLDFNHMSE